MQEGDLNAFGETLANEMLAGLDRAGLAQAQPQR